MSLDAYYAAIAKKRVSFTPRGFTPSALHPALKPHQEHCVSFAVETGSAALFLDTGLGKTLCALDWARAITERTNKPVLMLAPLAVAAQHAREAERFGLDAIAIREPNEITRARTYITNYDRLAKARDDKAEKHLCPMPLNITERAVALWSNRGDTVLSPFMGIGSEGHVALRTGRRFIGFELNPTYFNDAVANLAAAEQESAHGSLLSLMGA